MFVNGPDGNLIDCMFFPCTQKEEIKVYTDDEIEKMKYSEDNYDDPEKSSVNRSTIFKLDGQPSYLTKATIIMCNPNALFYQ